MERNRRFAALARRALTAMSRAMMLLAALATSSAIALVASIGVAAPAAGDAAALSVDQIVPGVYVHAGRLAALDAPEHDDIANIGFVAGSRCVAVIDTGGSVRIGRALRAAVKAHVSAPICYVINTHAHVDHVLGNFAFKDDAPKFVGHAALADAMALNRRFFVEHYPGDFDGEATADQVIGPDLTVADTLDLDLGGHRLHLRAWPTAHTDSDLTVLVDDRVLWTGDLLFRTRVPALDGSARGWLAAIDTLARMRVERVVPGHGAVTRDLGAALAPERRYLDVLVDGVRHELDAGQSIDDAIRRVGLTERSNWQLWDTAHAHNVSRAYQELEWN